MLQKELSYVLLILGFVGCAHPTEEPPIETGTPTELADQRVGVSDRTIARSRSEGPTALLVEVTAEVGLEESEVIWPDGEYFTPEITPGGIALFDYDQDGDLDIYQICHCEPGPMPDAFTKPAPNRLYEQQDGRFVEVPGAAGLDDPGFGHGVSVGDIDNDGDPDVFVTNFGEDHLYLNVGKGRFERVDDSEIDGTAWSSASSFVDYDQDGYLDLFVVHFAAFNPERRCGAAGSDTEQDYCGPHLFDGLRDQLFRNNGDGTFTDVSQELGITTPARGWGVLTIDMTGDSLVDIYVCNDEEPNQLWVNQGDGTYFDEAAMRGAAFNAFGRVEASMGVTLGDVNLDGTLDLFMTHVTSETNTLYVLENEIYTDFSSQAGTASVDLPFTGWGCGFFDIDHDGDLDLAVANGRVAIGSVSSAAKLGDFWNRYAEPNLLFLNDGSGNFANASKSAGAFAQRQEVTRGMAFGDLDNDGDVDIVTNDIANRLRVFRNDAPLHSATPHHWLQVLAISGDRVDVGAKVKLVVGERHMVRPVLRSYSYLASNDPRVHFGLGQADTVSELVVTWSDGSREWFTVDGVDRELTVSKGSGSANR